MRAVPFLTASRRRCGFAAAVAFTVVGIAAALTISETRTLATTDRLPAAMRHVSREPRYTEVPIHLPGKSEINPYRLSDNNQIVGPLIRDLRGKLQDDHVMASWDGKHLVVDAQGDIKEPNVRGEYLGGPQDQDFVSANGTRTHLPMDYGVGINNHSQVLGDRENASGEMTLVLWNHGKSEKILFGLSDLEPEGINDRGQVLAIDYQEGLVSADSKDHSRPIAYLLDPIRQRWTATNLFDFLPKSEWPDGPDGISEFYLNNRGEILVCYGCYGCEIGRRSLLWQGGQAMPIGPPNVCVYALAFNDAGQVIGGYGADITKSRPFLWQDGHFYKLNEILAHSHIAPVDEVDGINQSGYILALRKSGDEDSPHTQTVLLRLVQAR